MEMRKNPCLTEGQGQGEGDGRSKRQIGRAQGSFRTV